ncbi:MAG: Spy/CpxP family protein refolding chaperone [Caulobacteraceae bacterium]
MTSSPRLFLLAALAASLAVPAAGLAQDQYGPPPGPPRSNGEPPPVTAASQAQRLRETLRLRPDQDGALQAFVQAMAPPTTAMERMRRREETTASMPTPQRLDMMLAGMDEMRAITVARIDATKRFYAQLTPVQQRAFDAMQAERGRESGGSR